MNDVIRKCVKELAEPEPRLDYVRGMLDTLLSMNEPKSAGNTNIQYHPAMPATKTILSPLDEVEMLNAQAKAAVEQAKRLSELGQ